MDANTPGSGQDGTHGRPDGLGHSPSGPGGSRTLSRRRIGELLGEWQPGELRVARGFAECRGLSQEQLEDVYQETALALLTRPHASEGHVRNALRHGIKHRALNVHRDERRHAQILAHRAPDLQRAAESRRGQAEPEQASLKNEDRLIVREFLTELDDLEQRVFWLTAEGMRYRAIAPALGVPVNAARKASRSCERKRERFQLLYDTGRLCGYRAATIQALQAGETTSHELAERAFAHLENCAHCRAEHETNAQRLRSSSPGNAAALLPLAARLRNRGWWRDPTLRGGLQVGQSARDVLERAAALLDTSGAGAKIAAVVVAVAVLAGGALTATNALQHRSPQPHRLASKPRRSARPTDPEERPRVASVDLRVNGSSLQRQSHRLHTGVGRAHTTTRILRAGQNADGEFGAAPPLGEPARQRQPTPSSATVGQDPAEREFGIGPPNG